MNIDRDNFQVQFPLFKEKLKKATFISFDEEMTGIFPVDSTKRNSKTDDPYFRFAKMTTVSSRFCIMQFGICIFIQKNENEYEVSPYNFLIFPSGQNAEVILSASTVDFHRKNNLDFQKWIYKGLPFVDAYGQIALEKKYNQDSSTSASTTTTVDATPSRTPIALTKPSDIEYLERNVTELRKMMERTSYGPNSETVVNEYVFESSNAYLRRAVYEYLEIHCPPSNYIVSKTAEQNIKVKKVPAIVKQDYDNFIRAENKAKFEQEMGFRLVFNELVSSKKPMVGHNCTFDLMFLLQWLDKPLSTDLDVFKTRLSALLPIVFDTKYIASSGILNGQVFEDTMLESLHRQMQAYVQVQNRTNLSDDNSMMVEGSTSGFTFSFASDSPGYVTGVEDSSTDKLNSGNGSGDVASKAQFHDAGWDAYCTGLVFATELQMARLSVDQMRLKAGNKMFMMQSMYTMDLDPAQPSSILKVRGVVFYLYNFPASTSVPDILAAFIALGHRREDLELTWVDGTSTFVTIAGPLPTPEADIVRVYSAQLCSSWKIETLAQFRARSTSTTVSQAADVTTTSSSVWSWMSSFVSSFTSGRSSDNSSDTAQVSKKRKI